MGRSSKRRLSLAVRTLAYSLLICGIGALTYSTLFVHAYDKAPIKTALQDAVAKWQQDHAAVSEESQASEVPDWPEGTDYGYAMTDPNAALNKTIVLDPGHGGSDGGSIAEDGTLEKNVTLDLCQKIRDHLQKQNPTLNVVMTRESDDISDWSTSSWADLSHRMQVQSDSNADYFVSIHTHTYDDADVSGIQFYLNANDETSQTLSGMMAENLMTAGFSQNRGNVTMEEYPLQLISMSNAHAMQIEVGTLSNAEDLALLENEQAQEQIAAGIASALAQWIAANPDAPAYQSKQKEVEAKTQAEIARRQEEERKKSEEEAKRKQEEEEKKKSEEAAKSAS